MEVRQDALHRLMATISRQAIFALLAGIGFLYAAPLVSPWPTLALYTLGWLVVVATGRPAAGVLVTGVLSAVTLLLTWFLGTVLLPPAGGFLEELLSIVPYSVLPAALLVPTVFAWEWWLRSRRLGRFLFVPLVGAVIVGALWTQAEYRTDLLGHPWQYALLSLLLVALLSVHQIVSPVRDLFPRRTEDRWLRSGESRHVASVSSVASVAYRGRRHVLQIAIPVIVLLLILGVYRGWQDDAVAAGGGLLRPTMFRFDFADVISLESEIQLSRDLVILYREERPPGDRLLRRYVLSGYSPRRGFFRLDPGDEPSRAPPLSVRTATETLNEPTAHAGERLVSQEYYIVNFDPDAFVSVAEPRTARTHRQTSGSSFNNAYSVVSQRPAGRSEQLRRVPWPDDLPREWASVYVDTPVPEAIDALAREITAGVEGYYDTVAALEQYLLREYYYSLAPGIAPDGDQLSHFLFVSRKGYCSYFAFAMALMARTLGIPARVAAGFFVVPDTGMLGFHPIRGDMAHAWVEVYFPGVGWVEFDPTSQQLAPGENFATDYQIDRDQLAGLVEEVLAMPDSGESTPGPGTTGVVGTREVRTVMRILVRYWYLVLIGLLVIRTTERRLRWKRIRERTPHRAALLEFLRTRDSLAATGLGLSPATPLAATEEPLHHAGILAARARFGPDFSHRSLRKLEDDCHAARSDRMVELRGQRRFPAMLLLYLRTRTVPLPRSRRGGRIGSFLLVAAVVLVVAGGYPPALPAQDLQEQDLPAPDVEVMENHIRRAMDAENYEEALRRIENARLMYPRESRFPFLEGDLYYGQELFVPAERAYRAALALGAPEYSTRYALSRTLARLNRDSEAIVQLEILHAGWPDDTFIVGDLAWLYFKRHRLTDARDLLERTLETYGSERDLLMTLATVYAGLYDYPAALEAYNDAISRAIRHDDRFFQAVAYYNLSILHANFYRWGEALTAAERSLDAAERSSGYMIRAELHHRRMHLDRTVADYNRADLLDRDTPLPGLSLAGLLTSMGHPERAIQRLDRILARENANWMYSYGTDPARYQLRVYSVLAESWSAAARRDRRFRPGSILDRIRIRTRSVFRHIVAWYYRGMTRRQARLVAAELEQQGRVLPAARQRMVAAEAFPRIAARYATRAEELETRFNPEAALDYRLLEARTRGDANALESLVDSFDNEWRGVDRVAAMREIYRIRGHRNESGLWAAAELYGYAPGSFLVEGLRIPIDVDAEGIPAVSVRTIRRRLSRLGFVTAPNSPLQLVLRGDESNLRYSMYGGDGSVLLRSGEIRGRATLGDALTEMARNLTSSSLPDSSLPVDDAASVGQTRSESDEE